MRSSSVAVLLLIATACGSTSESNGLPQAEGSYALRSVDFIPLGDDPPTPIPTTLHYDDAPWDSVTISGGELLLRPDSGARLVIAHKVWTGTTWTPANDSIEGRYTYVGSDYPPDHSYHRLFNIYNSSRRDTYFWILPDGRALVPAEFGNKQLPEYYFHRH